MLGVPALAAIACLFVSAREARWLALGATLVIYTATEFAHGYGFLAVFVAGLMIRRSAQGHEFNKRLHDFADESERLLMMLLLLLFGGMLAAGLLKGIGWEEMVFAAVMVSSRR